MYLILILLLLIVPFGARADRNIVTPSAYTLSSGIDTEFTTTVTGPPRTVDYLDVGESTLQLEAAYTARPGIDRLSESVQVMALPETLVTPAISLGVSDIFNDAGAFSSNGFYGRGYYVAATKSLGNLVLDPASNGLIVTGGLGGGAYHGIFGGVTAMFPMNLSATTEYDGRSANYRISLKVAPIAQISFSLINGLSTVGLEIHSIKSL